MKILADATLPALSALFTPSFELTRYNSQNEVSTLLPTHDILLCRSTLKVTEQLLAGSQIKCVATASSGIDHIDCDYLKKREITLFDAKGCNAPAVADYVVATLASLSRSGHTMGKKAGVIGAGEVGTRVIARLKAAGFDVIYYDPFKAKINNTYDHCSLDELTTCDLLCIHANFHETTPHPTANLIATDFLARLKHGVTIINAARGGIVNETDLLQTNKEIIYCTDVYSREPKINKQLVDFSTLCTPHIAGHSIEAKYAAVFKISQQLHQHFGLPTITIRPSSINHARPLLKTNWQDQVLALYEPLIDTRILKQTNDLTHTFLTQRQAHQNRHDFSFYDAHLLDVQTKSLLGH